MLCQDSGPLGFHPPGRPAQDQKGSSRFCAGKNEQALGFDQAFLGHTSNGAGDWVDVPNCLNASWRERCSPVPVGIACLLILPRMLTCLGSLVRAIGAMSAIELSKLLARIRSGFRPSSTGLCAESAG